MILGQYHHLGFFFCLQSLRKDPCHNTACKVQSVTDIEKLEEKQTKSLNTVALVQRVGGGTTSSREALVSVSITPTSTFPRLFCLSVVDIKSHITTSSPRDNRRQHPIVSPFPQAARRPSASVGRRLKWPSSRVRADLSVCPSSSVSATVAPSCHRSLSIKREDFVHATKVRARLLFPMQWKCETLPSWSLNQV